MISRTFGFAALLTFGAVVSPATSHAQSHSIGGTGTLPGHIESLAAHSKSPLRITGRFAIPISTNVMTVTAEAPNGAVFIAPLSTEAAYPSVVWVFDAASPAAVAEHVPTGITAMAADKSNLYVASYNAVVSFNRHTGDKVRIWLLPKFSTANTSDADLVSISAYNGVVQVAIPLGTVDGIYRINADSASAPKLVARASSFAFGPRGSVFYVQSNNHLVKLAANGGVIVGPKLADRPTALGGGVQFVNAAAGGLVWVSEPAGQGLDASFKMYNQSSLKLVGSSNDATVSEEIVASTAGALVLGGEDSPGKCPQHPGLSVSCVFRISSNAVLSGATPVGPATQLIGPAPAVITTNAGDTRLFLERLSS